MATEKMMPHNERAEEALLACLMQYDDAMDDVITIIKPDDFYSSRNSSIFRCMYQLYSDGQPLFAVDICYAMGKDDDDELFNFLVHLSEGLSLRTDAVTSAKIVANEAKRRRLMAYGNHVFGDAAADMDAAAVMERAESALLALSTDQTPNQARSADDIAASYFEKFTQLEQHNGEIGGLPTGFKLLDYNLRGLKAQNMVVIAARPGMGKSSLAMSIAYNNAFHENPAKRWAYFTLEMSGEEVFNCLVSMRARVDGQRLKTPWMLDEFERERVHRAIRELQAEQFFIQDTPAITTADLRSQAKRLHRMHKLDFIIIDYLQLMRALDSSGKRIKDRQQEIAEISMAIKALAKELNIPVIALAQLNREVENRQSKVPQLSDLRESGQIEQDSDVVMFIYRDEMYNADTERKGQADIIVAKHRNGPTGEVSLHFEGRYTQFSNLEIRMEVAV